MGAAARTAKTLKLRLKSLQTRMEEESGEKWKKVQLRVYQIAVVVGSSSRAYP